MDRGVGLTTVYGVTELHNWATNTFTFLEEKVLVVLINTDPAVLGPSDHRVRDILEKKNKIGCEV